MSLDQKIQDSTKILDLVDGFVWRFGDKFVHYRTANVGLQAQWLEAWWPSSDHEFAFVVEDDLEVSPLFYKFLRGLIVNYYYNSSNFNPNVYGASLQRPRFVPGKHGNKLQLDSETRLFLYQLVGTWGQLLFPKPWKEFRLWYETHKAKGIPPILQGMVTTGWYKRMGERIWTPWFIKFIHSRGYFNIYTNFMHEGALSVSNRDAGVNYGRSAGPDSQLLDNRSLDPNSFIMPPLSNLKWYDFCFREVLPGRILKSVDDLGAVLPSVQKDRRVILVSLFDRTPQILATNLICHFERRNIRSYIFIGPDLDFLLDLARRGHPVIHTREFLNSIRDSKLKDLQGYQSELLQETLVKAYVIKKCLDLGYDSWVMASNVIPVSGDIFSNAKDLSYDASASRNSKILFVRNSPRISKIWNDVFIFKIGKVTDSMITSNKVALKTSHFSDLVVRALGKKGAAIRRVDEMDWALEIGAQNANSTSIDDRKKLVYWLPKKADTDVDFIPKRLEDFGLWELDGDNSCASVVCHPS